MNRIFEMLYKVFGTLTEKSFTKFLYKRLPIYLLGILILMVGGVKGLMITFLMVMAFSLGWLTNKIVSVVRDYRLTQRLNRVHFTQVEYETAIRERNLALEALRNAKEEKRQGGKQAPMPASPSAFRHTRMSQDEIAMIMQELAVQGGVPE